MSSGFIKIGYLFEKKFVRRNDVCVTHTGSGEASGCENWCNWQGQKVRNVRFENELFKSLKTKEKMSGEVSYIYR